MLLCVSFTYQRQICVYNYSLNSSFIWYKNLTTVFLKQAKPFVEFTLLFVTSVQCWHTWYHKSHITCNDPHFLLVQSIISIIYHPWLYWKFVLDNNFLRVSDFCEGLSPMLLMTSLSKDKVPSVEKPYAYFISYRNVNKISPIESIKTKCCL